MLDFLLGSVEENAERELQNYRPGKGRKKDLGDHLGDFFTGRGAAIDRAVEQQYVDNLETTYGTRIGELSTPNVTAPKIDKDTDARVLKQQLAVAEPKAQAYKDMMTQAAGKGIVIDTTQLTTPDAGYAYIAKELERKEEAKRKLLQGERLDETRRQERRVDSKENIARLDRLSREKADLALRRDDMEYRYAAMARQDRLDAQNRRDKAIMALMQGLGNLGAAFTI